MAACSSTAKFSLYMKRMLLPCVLWGEFCSRKSLRPGISWWLVKDWLVEETLGATILS